MASSHRARFIVHLPKSVKQLLKRFYIAFFIIIALTLVLISKPQSGFLGSVRDASLEAFSPVMRMIEGVSSFISGVSGGTSDYFFVYEKNQALQTENEGLKQKLAKLKQNVKENAELKELLHFIKETTYDYRTVRVVGHTGGAFLNTLLINAGEKKHVMRGQAVVGKKGMIGRVIEVSPSLSRVLLVTDINSKIPVVGGQSKERAILQGSGKALPELLYLPKESMMTNGEAVLTSGDGEVYPAGIRIGKVEIAEDGHKFVRPFVDWNVLQFVSVLQKSSSENDPVEQQAVQKKGTAP